MMYGASRVSLASAREALDALADNTTVDMVRLADELAAVTWLLDREPPLRRVLTDPAQDGQAKADLLTRLLSSQVSGETMDLLRGLVRSRWSASRDLTDTIEEMSSTAELIGAQRTGELDDVEDELFRFGRILASSTDLQLALTTPVATGEAKAELVHSLVGGRINATTERLVTRLVAHPRGRSLEAGIDAYSKLAAARRGRIVGRVTSAVPLSEVQRDRLVAVLERLFGHRVHLNLDVDPQIMGGIMVRVGDEIVDGTILGRLESASRRITT